MVNLSSTFQAQAFHWEELTEKQPFHKNSLSPHCLISPTALQPHSTEGGHLGITPGISIRSRYGPEPLFPEARGLVFQDSLFPSTVEKGGGHIGAELTNEEVGCICSWHVDLL